MVQGFYCPTHYQIAIDAELEFIDAQEAPLPTDFVVIRRRKEAKQCQMCNDITPIFITRGHYDGPAPPGPHETAMEKGANVDIDSTEITEFYQKKPGRPDIATLTDKEKADIRFLYRAIEFEAGERSGTGKTKTRPVRPTSDT